MAIVGLSPEMKRYFSGMTPPKTRNESSSTTGSNKSSREQELDSTTPTSVLNDDPLSFRQI